MNISNDTPAVNFVDYFTKQFLTDLGNMANLRDELAKRQGALSAVEAALADREAAAAELAAAKAEAADIVELAKDKLAKAKAKDEAAASRETAVADAEKATADKARAVEADLSGRLVACAKVEAQQAAVAATLDARATQLDADEAALATRVKDFQSKVAALSA